MNINVYIYVHYNIYITFTSMSSMSTCFNLRMMMPLSEVEETDNFLWWLMKIRIDSILLTFLVEIAVLWTIQYC